jgi:quinol monooxygenase YgiN
LIADPTSQKLPEFLDLTRAILQKDNLKMTIPGMTVVARFQARRGQENQVRRALLDMVEPTTREAANIGYALHVMTDDPTIFFLYEQWQDGSGLDDHMKQPYFAELRRKLADLLEAPPEVIRLQMIGGETASASM